MKNLDEIIAAVKNNEEVMNKANKAIENFKVAYQNANEEVDIDHLYEYDEEVFVDYEPAVQCFVDALDDELDIDLLEVYKSDEFKQSEELCWNDYDGCMDNEYQLAIFILSQVTDYPVIQDLDYSGDFAFPFDDEIIDRKKGLHTLEYCLTNTDYQSDTIVLDSFEDFDGDDYEFTIEDVKNVDSNYQYDWIYIEEDKALFRRYAFNKLIALGEVKNINNCIAINTTDEDEVKDILDDTFYAVIKNENGYVVTDLPYSAIQTDIYYGIDSIGNTIWQEDDGMTNFLVGDEYFDEVQSLKNYLTIIRKSIKDIEEDYTYHRPFITKGGEVYGNRIKTDLPWDEYKKNTEK